MTGEPQDLLIERAVSAYRDRDSSGQIVPSPAWWDLSPEGREEVFRRQLLSRILEREISRARRSTTVQAVFNRLGLV